jgi:hypothetical protein
MVGFMRGAWRLLIAFAFVAAPARAEPPARTLDTARWSPPLVSLIVDPWRDAGPRKPLKVALRDDLDRIVDPWAHRGPRPRLRSVPNREFALLELVDPWARPGAPRRRVPTAAFPPVQ